MLEYKNVEKLELLSYELGFTHNDNPDLILFEEGIEDPEHNPVVFCRAKLHRALDGSENKGSWVQQEDIAVMYHHVQDVVEIALTEESAFFHPNDKFYEEVLQVISRNAENLEKKGFHFPESVVKTMDEQTHVTWTGNAGTDDQFGISTFKFDDETAKTLTTAKGANITSFMVGFAATKKSNAPQSRISQLIK